MRQPRPTKSEIAETLKRLAALHGQLEAEGAFVRASVIKRAISLIERLAPHKGDGDGGKH